MALVNNVLSPGRVVFAAMTWRGNKERIELFETHDEAWKYAEDAPAHNDEIEFVHVFEMTYLDSVDVSRPVVATRRHQK